MSRVYGPYMASSGINYMAKFAKRAPGQHTYTISATDKLGSVSTFSGTFTVAAPALNKYAVDTLFSASLATKDVF